IPSPITVPGVAIPALDLDFGQFNFLDSVPAAEEEPIGLDLVEPRPDGQRLRIAYDEGVGVRPLDSDAAQFGRVVPPGAGLDGLHGLGLCPNQAHQEQEDGRALASPSGLITAVVVANLGADPARSLEGKGPGAGEFLGGVRIESLGLDPLIDLVDLR